MKRIHLIGLVAFGTLVGTALVASNFQSKPAPMVKNSPSPEVAGVAFTPVPTATVTAQPSPTQKAVTTSRPTPSPTTRTSTTTAPQATTTTNQIVQASSSSTPTNTPTPTVTPTGTPVQTASPTQAPTPTPDTSSFEATLQRNYSVDNVTVIVTANKNIASCVITLEISGQSMTTNEKVNGNTCEKSANYSGSVKKVSADIESQGGQKVHLE